MEIKRVLGMHALCVAGTMDKVAGFFQDALGVKLGAELSNFLPFGFHARATWLGGDSHLAISESTNDELPLGKQHKRSAPSFQFLQLQVASLDEAIAELRTKGIRVTDKRFIPHQSFEVEGKRGLYESMIHPKSTFGFLIELMQFDKTRPEGKGSTGGGGL